MLDEYSMQKLKSFGHKMHPLWMAFLLTACGGGSSKTTGDGGTPTEPGILRHPVFLRHQVVSRVASSTATLLTHAFFWMQTTINCLMRLKSIQSQIRKAYSRD